MSLCWKWGEERDPLSPHPPPRVRVPFFGFPLLFHEVSSFLPLFFPSLLHRFIRASAFPTSFLPPPLQVLLARDKRTDKSVSLLFNLRFRGLCTTRYNQSREHFFCAGCKWMKSRRNGVSRPSGEMEREKKGKRSRGGLSPRFWVALVDQSKSATPYPRSCLIWVVPFCDGLSPSFFPLELRGRQFLLSKEGFFSSSLPSLLSSLTRKTPISLLLLLLFVPKEALLPPPSPSPLPRPLLGISHTFPRVKWSVEKILAKLDPPCFLLPLCFFLFLARNNNLSSQRGSERTNEARTV